MASAAHPKIYWVDAPDVGRLAVVSRPEAALGLPRQMQALREAGIDTLISLLAPQEAARAGLGQEAEAARAAGLTFDTLPTSDFAVPASFPAAAQVIERVVDDLRAGLGVGAHCFAGRGRSPLFIAAVLVHHGYPPQDAVNVVSAARGHRIPETAAQHAWIAEFAGWCRDGRPN